MCLRLPANLNRWAKRKPMRWWLVWREVVKKVPFQSPWQNWWHLGPHPVVQIEMCSNYIIPMTQHYVLFPPTGAIETVSRQRTWSPGERTICFLYLEYLGVDLGTFGWQPGWNEWIDWSLELTNYLIYRSETCLWPGYVYTWCVYLKGQICNLQSITFDIFFS